MVDLDALQLLTYDCSHAALRARLHAHLQADAELLTEQFRSAIDRLRKCSSDMGIVESICTMSDIPSDPVEVCPRLTTFLSPGDARAFA